MPDLLALEQEDLRDLDSVADAFLRVTSSLDPDRDLPKLPKGFVEHLARFAEEVVALALNFASRLPPRWEQYKRDGWAGQAEQVHRRRDSFLRSFEARLQHLAQAMRMATIAAVLTHQEIAGSGRLPEAIEKLNGLKQEIFGKWNTLEDLQEMLVETHPLTAEQFDAMATQHRPPQGWYDQEEQSV